MVSLLSGASVSLAVFIVSLGREKMSRSCLYEWLWRICFCLFLYYCCCSVFFCVIMVVTCVLVGMSARAHIHAHTRARSRAHTRTHARAHTLTHTHTHITHTLWPTLPSSWGNRWQQTFHICSPMLFLMLSYSSPRWRRRPSCHCSNQSQRASVMIITAVLPVSNEACCSVTSHHQSIAGTTKTQLIMLFLLSFSCDSTSIALCLHFRVTLCYDCLVLRWHTIWWTGH